MRTMGRLVIGVIVTLGIASGGAAAKSAIDFMRIVPMDVIKSMKDTWKLTDDQMNRYKMLREAYAKKVKDSVALEVTKQSELVTLLKAEKPDSAAVEAKIKEMLAAEQVQVAAAAQFYTDFAANLTKEQQPLFWAEAGKKFLKEKEEESPKTPAPTTPAQPPAQPPKTDPPKN